MERKVKCLQCGTVFSTDHPTKKFCSKQCGNKYNHKPNENADDSAAEKALQKCNTDWKYIGGYTGSDGFMIIKHSCGYIVRKSCTTIRHHKVRCEVCETLERKQRKFEQKQQEAKQREVTRFFKPVKKHKQTAMKECPICGCFFYGGNKYCSSECAKEPARHRYAMKKNRRKEKGWTTESKTISLAKLYERDNGICYLCGKKCEYSEDYNSNTYPTIDHVVPIAKGGMDEWKNIRLAHRFCNLAKGVEIVECNAVDISPRSQKMWIKH